MREISDSRRQDLWRWFANKQERSEPNASLSDIQNEFLIFMGDYIPQDVEITTIKQTKDPQWRTLSLGGDELLPLVGKLVQNTIIQDSQTQEPSSMSSRRLSRNDTIPLLDDQSQQPTPEFVQATPNWSDSLRNYFLQNYPSVDSSSFNDLNILSLRKDVSSSQSNQLKGGKLGGDLVPVDPPPNPLLDQNGNPNIQSYLLTKDWNVPLGLKLLYIYTLDPQIKDYADYGLVPSNWETIDLSNLTSEQRNRIGKFDLSAEDDGTKVNLDTSSISGVGTLSDPRVSQEDQLKNVLYTPDQFDHRPWLKMPSYDIVSDEAYVADIPPVITIAEKQGWSELQAPVSPILMSHHRMKNRKKVII